MFEFLSKLFDTSDFPARWNCGNWTAGHGLLHVLSDLGGWSAYVAIPCVLGYFVLRRKDIPFCTIFLPFGAFILACGTTHLMEAMIFWWPAYRLAAVRSDGTEFPVELTITRIPGDGPRRRPRGRSVAPHFRHVRPSGPLVGESTT